MATFSRFEDIEAWQGSRHVARAIYEVTNRGSFSRNFGLRDQIRRSAVSIMANIAEGFGRGGNREFSLFLGVARGLAAELKSHLYVALDAGFIDRAEFDDLLRQTSRIEAQLSALMKYLATSDYRGARLRPAGGR